jgi:hypothetical protein
MLPSLDRLTRTIYCYKKIILNLITLPITQPRLHFTSSLAKLNHHVIRALPTAVIHFYHCLMLIVPPHDTHGNKIVDHISLLEQLIGM